MLVPSSATIFNICCCTVSKSSSLASVITALLSMLKYSAAVLSPANEYEFTPCPLAAESVSVAVKVVMVVPRAKFSSLSNVCAAGKVGLFTSLQGTLNRFS